MNRRRKLLDVRERPDSLDSFMEGIKDDMRLRRVAVRSSCTGDKGEIIRWFDLIDMANYYKEML